ncbi:MAG TPA: alpha/beta hydrolase, partial [Ramlibacter sp.]|nr:alpha/beta hydrolase [Ramlibacter sp.]
MHGYRAPWWLPGGNLQTIWPALFAKRTRGAPPRYRRERWTTPDGDFVDLDWLERDVGVAARTQPTGGGDAARGQPTGSARRSGSQAERATPTPLLILFHGLEGSSRSHYAEAFADFAAANGAAFVVPHFRGCSGEINLAPLAYHSGDHAEISWILARLRE